MVENVAEMVLDGERKEALGEFEKEVKKIQRRQEKHQARFGYSGQDFQIRTKSGQYLNCHRSESGTLYVRDKRGSLRKATNELMSELVEELQRMSESAHPTLRNTSLPLLDKSLPTTLTRAGGKQK